MRGARKKCGDLGWQQTSQRKWCNLELHCISSNSQMPATCCSRERGIHTHRMQNYERARAWANDNTRSSYSPCTLDKRLAHKASHFYTQGSGLFPAPRNSELHNSSCWLSKHCRWVAQNCFAGCWWPRWPWWCEQVPLSLVYAENTCNIIWQNKTRRRVCQLRHNNNHLRQEYRQSWTCSRYLLDILDILIATSVWGLKLI